MTIALRYSSIASAKIQFEKSIKVFVVAVTHKPNGNIHPADYPHGHFEADRNELLMDFIARIGMPTEGAYRITLPEWGITGTDLGGTLKEYDIRDGDCFYIMYEWARPPAK